MSYFFAFLLMFQLYGNSFTLTLVTSAVSVQGPVLGVHPGPLGRAKHVSSVPTPPLQQGGHPAKLPDPTPNPQLLRSRGQVLLSVYLRTNTMPGTNKYSVNIMWVDGQILVEHKQEE